MKSIPQKRLWIGASLCAVCLLAAGCGETPAVAEGTPTPVPSAAVVQMSVSEVATPVPLLDTNVVLPTDTPEPSATETPFSYYAPTVNMTFDELVGSTTDFGEFGSSTVNWPKGYPAADTYKLIVDVYWQVVMAYKKDANGEYTVPVRYMLCSTGTSRIPDGSETQRGTFKMKKTRVRFGHFLSGEAAQYWSLIRGRTYFHSILYDKQNDISTYMVDSYNALGSKASHACIRLTVPDARWIWYNISYDTVCVIRDGSKDDAETGWIRSQLILPTAPVSQNKSLRAGQTPMTDNWSISDVATDLPFVNEKQPVPPATSDNEPDVGDGQIEATATPGPTATPAPTTTHTPEPTATPAATATPVPAQTPDAGSGTGESGTGGSESGSGGSGTGGSESGTGESGSGGSSTGGSESGTGGSGSGGSGSEGGSDGGTGEG